MRPDYSVNAATLVTGVVSMKLGFVCLNLLGHLDPMTALARQLQARNHDVVFRYSPVAARRARTSA
jgi:UDP:flavonoid glycosyltransferase YjiC (YdhE family)